MNCQKKRKKQKKKKKQIRDIDQNLNGHESIDLIDINHIVRDKCQEQDCSENGSHGDAFGPEGEYYNMLIDEATRYASSKKIVWNLNFDENSFNNYSELYEYINKEVLELMSNNKTEYDDFRLETKRKYEQYILDRSNNFKNELKEIDNDNRVDPYENIMEKLKNPYKLNLKEIEWLKKEPRACYWFWFNIAFESNYGNLQYLYLNELGLSKLLVGNELRYDSIMTFFSNKENRFKKEAYERLKIQWNMIISEFPTMLNWINNSSLKMRHWAIDYLQEHIPIHPIVLTSMYNEPKLPLSILIDLWNVPIESKKYILNNMNRAWHQHEARQRKKGKKAINAYLEPQTKDYLKYLCKHYNYKIDEMIEVLIREKIKAISVNHCKQKD